MEDKTKIKALERINLLLQVLQSNMKICNVALGLDTKEQKLILMDVKTKNIFKVGFAELNTKALEREFK